MSGGDTRAQFQFASFSSNDSSNDTSSVQILLNTAAEKTRKHRKILLYLLGAVICFVFLLCIILLVSKPENDVNLGHRNDTDSGSNSSSNQKTPKNKGNPNNGRQNKKYKSHKYLG